MEIITPAARVGGYIITYTGIKYYPLDPRPEDVCIADIAHSLAGQNRFGAHTVEMINTAHHSVDVSMHPEVGHPRWGLFHDGGEAYLVDLPSPIKHAIAFAAEFDRLETLNLLAIAQRFNLPWPVPSSIKAADNYCLRTEQQKYMAAFGGTCTPWDRTTANLRFLERYLALSGEKGVSR